MTAEAPLGDPARLAALRALSVYDPRADDAFDRLTRLAARFLDAPAALVNVVEAQRQVTRSAYSADGRFRRGDEAPMGDSICRIAVATGLPLVIPDTAGDARVSGTACVRDGVGAYAGIPLVLSSGHALGTLCVVDDRPRVWTRDELAVLADLAAAATTELELRAATQAAQGRAAAEANARRLEAVQRVTDAALTQATLDDTVAAILDCVRTMLHADSATMLLVDDAAPPDAPALRVRASVGLAGDDTGVAVPLGVGIAGRIGACREPAIVPDVRRAEVVQPSVRAGVRSLLGAPLVLDDALLGVVHVGTATRRDFDEDDVRLLQLAATRIATAIDRARLFDAERAARLAAETASRAKSEFLAVMSHELRTPLNAIGGYAELIADGVMGPVPDAQRAMLDRVREGQRQLTRVIDDILQVVDLDRHGPARAPASPVPVAPLVAEADAALAALAAAHGLLHEPAGDVPDAMVCADRAMLQDILQRLMTNAVKFTPRGGRVGIAARTDGDAVVLEVHDTGPGIPPEHRARVFEPFGRLDATYRRASEGVGLGLAIARGHARRFGGTLEADEAPGGGTVVRLTLPRARASADAAASRTPDGPSAPG